MKSYIKGIITGAAVTALLCSIPSFAQRIDTVFNTIRINTDGIDAVQWGENYTLDNGAEVPYSIVYNDTTYVPLRKISGLTGKSVYWNGDTQTAYIAPSFDMNTKTELTVQPDKNGNMWEYYTVKAKDKSGMYLVALDKERDYRRIYRTAYSDNNAAVWVKEDGIYFVRIMDDYSPVDVYPNRNTIAHLYKIPYLNDADNQDGEEIREIRMLIENNTLIDGDYLYHYSETLGNLSHAIFYAENVFTGETAEYAANSWETMYSFAFVSQTPDKTVLRCNFKSSTIPAFACNITINKNPLSIEKPVMAEE